MGILYVQTEFNAFVCSEEYFTPLDDVNISLKKYVDDYKLTYNQMIEFRARALEWEFQ
ncbi:MAG: hypothetical protein ACPGSD_03975 [Flavobacteriales bacterium]